MNSSQNCDKNKLSPVVFAAILAIKKCFCHEF